MKHIKAPKHYSPSDKLVFLSGSIEMGVAEQWQERVVEMFADSDFTILNPRRDDWDDTWTQSIDFQPFREQVEWELDGLQDAEAVIVYFSPETRAPITLLELGILTKTMNEVVVVCPPTFYRKGNVDIVCKRYSINQADTLEEAVAMIKKAFPSKKKGERWNGTCKCGHNHDNHSKSHSINYTAGACRDKKCDCSHFIHDIKSA